VGPYPSEKPKPHYFPKAPVIFCCRYQTWPAVNAQPYCHPGGGGDMGTLSNVSSSDYRY